jgi:hypothetical protein
LVAVNIGGWGAVESGSAVWVSVGSTVAVSAAVSDSSTLGELIGGLVGVSLGSVVGWIISVVTFVRVDAGVWVEIAVAFPQAVNRISRVQVRAKRRRIPKLYP